MLLPVQLANGAVSLARASTGEGSKSKVSKDKGHTEDRRVQLDNLIGSYRMKFYTE